MATFRWPGNSGRVTDPSNRFKRLHTYWGRVSDPKSRFERLLK